MIFDHNRTRTCGPENTEVIQIPYEPRGKAKQSWARETHAFSINGVPGVSLSEALGGKLSGLDGRDDRIFQGLGQKITYHLLFPGYKHFSRQKWVKCTKDGEHHPVTREKIAAIVAQVLRTFIDSVQDAEGGASPGVLLEANYIPFEEFYLLKLEKYGSSVQPVLGRRSTSDAAPPASPSYEATPIPQTQPTSFAYEAVPIPLAQPAPYPRSVVNTSGASFMPPNPLGFPAPVEPVYAPGQNLIFDPGDGFGSGILYDARDFGFECNDTAANSSVRNVHEGPMAEDLISSLSGLSLNQSYGTYDGFYGYYGESGPDAYGWSC